MPVGVCLVLENSPSHTRLEAAILDTSTVADLNRMANEHEEQETVYRFAALAKLQYQRDYGLATLQKLPTGVEGPQPDFECNVAGEGIVRIEVLSLRDSNVVRLVKSLEPAVASTTDPALSLIGKKARKHYPHGSPIELLCFSDGLLVSPLDQVLADAASLDVTLKRSFSRAWLLWEGRELHALW